MAVRLIYSDIVSANGNLSSKNPRNAFIFHPCNVVTRSRALQAYNLLEYIIMVHTFIMYRLSKKKTIKINRNALYTIYGYNFKYTYYNTP